MTVPGSRDLHDALLRALQPATRTLHPHPQDGPPVDVNAAGVDVWDGHVGDVALDPNDGTAHAYAFVQDSPGGWAQTRTVARATLAHYRPVITVAGGTPRKVRWALDQIRPLLDGAILTAIDGTSLTGPLHEGFSRLEDYDPGPLQIDEDPQPPRWFVALQYATTAH